MTGVLVFSLCACAYVWREECFSANLPASVYVLASAVERG